MGYALARDDVEAPAILPDLTLGFDPADIWPDPMDCPPYPRFAKTVTDRATLLERLTGAVVTVSGFASEYSKPDPDAVSVFVADHFGPRIARFSDPTCEFLDRMGEPFAGKYPDPNKSHRAMALIEAIHLRGWLRKLETLDAKAKDEERAKAERRARARLDEWEKEVAELTAAIADRAEAEARHRQRVADERAAKANSGARHTLERHHRAAVEAAQVLGIDPPELPKECDG